MIWLKRISGLDSDTMREIADDAGVSWDTQTIVYQGGAIGYADGDSADETAIQDVAESKLGQRPDVIDSPE